MKKIIAISFLFVFLLIPASDAQLPFIVQIVYFKPVGAPQAPGNIAKVMADVQALYRSEMERNNYGAKTFRLEADANGKVIIHTVNGRNNAAHYRATTYNSAVAELPNKFLNDNNITIIVVGELQLVDNRVWGVGFPIYGGACGGRVVIPAKNANFGVQLIAHELGHAFGLYHNIIGDPSIMGRGAAGADSMNALNNYEARWLDKHHYFNDVHNINHVPEIVNVHRFKEIQQNIIRFRFDIETINTLHQAQVYRVSDVAIVGWVRLTGNRDTAEFLIRRNKLLNQRQIGIQFIDTQGNYNTLHVNLGDLPDDIVGENKNAVLIDGNTIEELTPEREDSKEDAKPKTELSTSPKNKVVTLWALIKRRR